MVHIPQFSTWQKIAHDITHLLHAMGSAVSKSLSWLSFVLKLKFIEKRPTDWVLIINPQFLEHELQWIEVDRGVEVDREDKYHCIDMGTPTATR